MGQLNEKCRHSHLSQWRWRRERCGVWRGRWGSSSFSSLNYITLLSDMMLLLRLEGRLKRIKFAQPDAPQRLGSLESHWLGGCSHQDPRDADLSQDLKVKQLSRKFICCSALSCAYLGGETIVKERSKFNNFELFPPWWCWPELG